MDAPYTFSTHRDRKSVNPSLLAGQHFSRPDGRLVGESYVLSSQGAVSQTRIALLDQDGASLPGWARSIRGTASPPSFGVDGGLFFSYFALDGSKWLRRSSRTERRGRDSRRTWNRPTVSSSRRIRPRRRPAWRWRRDPRLSPDGVTACDRRARPSLSRDPVDDPVASIFYVRSPGRPGVLAVVAGRSVSLSTLTVARAASSAILHLISGVAQLAVTRDGLVGSRCAPDMTAPCRCWSCSSPRTSAERPRAPLPGPLGARPRGRAAAGGAVRAYWPPARPFLATL